MASSHVGRIAFGVTGISLLLVLGTLATKMEEVTKYRLLIVQGLLFAHSLAFLSARYVWTYLLVIISQATVAGGILRKLLLVPLVFVLTMAQFAFISGYLLAGVEPHWFVVLNFSCFGTMMIMVTLVFLSQVLDSILALMNLRRGRHSSSNATFKAFCILILIPLFTISALINAAQPPDVKYFRIPVTNLPSCLKGLKVLQLSDVHIGPTVGRSRVEFIVEVSNKQKPDVILVTGDLVDAPLQIKPAVKPLAKLRSKYGTFFVAGNHDFYTGYINEWIEELKLLNITILQNRYLPLIGRSPSCAGEKIYLSGVFDREGGLLRSTEYGLKLSAALSGREPGVPTILLAHRPSAAKQAVRQFKDISLVLCGHTHGGQLFPFSLWFYLSEPYYSGLYKIHDSDSYIYVSSGVFFYGMPMRHFSTADISVLVLE